MPVRKRPMPRRARLLRLIASTLDPRAWIYAIKLVNYYNYSHVTPLRSVTLGPHAAISPNTAFSNPDRIRAGRNLYLGARRHLWAGPSKGHIVIGDNVLFGPEVMVTAAGYRFNDGSPVTAQAMDEADVIIGDDVWLGTRAIVLPGAGSGTAPSWPPAPSCGARSRPSRSPPACRQGRSATATRPKGPPTGRTARI